MKIYVAAKFENKDAVHALYAKLKALGHTIAYDWTTHQSIKPYDQNQARAHEYSKNELEGIANCDIFIFLSAQSAHTLFIELGAAIMAREQTGKPTIYAVGEFNSTSPWFFNNHVQRVTSIEEVLQKLKAV